MSIPDVHREQKVPNKKGSNDLVDSLQNFWICRKKVVSLQVQMGVNDSIYLGNSEQV